MMPWESWNVRDAAWLRIERASARKMEEEIAASEVVGEAGLGRGAAESVHGGVDPVGALCGLAELLEEEDHRERGRRWTRYSEQVCVYYDAD